MRKPLPPLLLFTDPARTPRPVLAAERLPRGAGVVFRPFGAPDALSVGRQLKRVCVRRGLIFFVGADPELAIRLNADGVHLPERLAGRTGAIRRLEARFLVTAAAHSTPAVLRASRAGAAAIVVSPVFVSASPSAGRPIGPRALARMAARSVAPVYALGGVNARTIRRLAMTGVVGIAAVEALAGART